MSQAAHDLMMQVAGLCAAILPVLALGLWLGLASRRRRAGEAADYVEPPQQA
jgi:hypothetical protein